MLDYRLSNLKFDMAALKPLIEHAKNAKEWRSVYGDPKSAKPGLLIVKDSGCYLMSNGTPFLPNDSTDPKSTKSKVVYADGCSPDDEWIGGDDFGEFLDLEFFEKALAQGAVAIKIKLTARRMSMSAVFPRKPRAKVAQKA